MPRLDAASGRVRFKVVFFGPGQGGKTTALKHLHTALSGPRRGELLNLSTETGRTLFFDFLPVDMGLVPEVGRPVRVDLYTVPGQVFYGEARRFILRHSDGVAFVADSAEGRLEDNVASLRDLKEGLAAWGLEYDRVSVAFLYNKRDLRDCAPVARLRELINPEGRPEFEGVAREGTGVMEVLEGVCDRLFDAYLAAGNPVSDHGGARSAPAP